MKASSAKGFSDFGDNTADFVSSSVPLEDSPSFVGVDSSDDAESSFDTRSKTSETS